MDRLSDTPTSTATLALDPVTLTTTTGILTIDLDAIVANWNKLKSQGVPAECAAVVKADAYGCGIKPVTRALWKAGCRTFFVATLDEARAVRDVARTAVIYVLDGFFPNSGPTFAEIDCRPVIGDATEFAEWEALRRITGRQGAAAIHIDTGMNRLGFSIAEAEALLPRIHAGNHGITLVMSHLANAELLNNPMNGRQVAAFRNIASRFSGVAASLSNSSGIFLGSQFHFDVAAARGCALRRKSDAGSRHADAACHRSEGAHRTDPPHRTRRHRRLWRDMDCKASNAACHCDGRLRRRLFPCGGQHR